MLIFLIVVIIILLVILIDIYIPHLHLMTIIRGAAWWLIAQHPRSAFLVLLDVLTRVN